jgi:hypothetical protein
MPPKSAARCGRFFLEATTALALHTCARRSRPNFLFLQAWACALEAVSKLLVRRAAHRAAPWPPSTVCRCQIVPAAEASAQTKLVELLFEKAILRYARGWQFRANRIRLSNVDAQRRSIPCSSQGSSPHRSLDWSWLLAHSLKPLQPRRRHQPHQPHQPLRRVHRSKVLGRSTRTGSRRIGLTSRVPRVLHSTGAVLALAAPRLVPGTFEPSP